MAVISVSIIESSEQVLAGIPRSITITTNIPATIFYTLDGTDPTLFSTIYTSPIFLPTESLSITIKILATNGTIYSPIVEETYITNMLENARLPHSSTSAVAGANIPGLYPFGTNPIQPNTLYLNPGDAAITVDNPALTELPTAYNGDGYPTAFTNEPFTIENYSIVYSTKNAQGQTGHGIGTIPATVTVQPQVPIPEETKQYSSLFDPRAFVIFQDTTLENPEDPPNINRQFFTLEDSEKIRDGSSYFNSGLDAPPVMGSFLRSHYNPRDNTMTYYYFDSHANRWIISKTPYTPTGTFDGNLAQIKFSRNKGAGVVFEWIPFQRRVLF